MKLRNKLLLLITKRMPARAIDLDDKHYIERYHVARIGKLSIMLHRYLGCDGDREVHDHPWKWSAGIPITGGYAEERVKGFCPLKGWISHLVNIRPWRWNFISAMRFHRIASVLPGTWTLFITYDRFKSWSFAHQSVSAMGSVVLYQPYDTEHTKDWETNAPRGEAFRAARGTAK